MVEQTYRKEISLPFWTSTWHYIKTTPNFRNQAPKTSQKANRIQKQPHHPAQTYLLTLSFMASWSPSGKTLAKSQNHIVELTTLARVHCEDLGRATRLFCSFWTVSWMDCRGNIPPSISSRVFERLCCLWRCERLVFWNGWEIWSECYVNFASQ